MLQNLLNSKDPTVKALLARELARREEARAMARRVESPVSNQADRRRVREATQSTAYWMRNHTRTFNPHWVEEGLSRPDMPFPEWYFFEPVCEIIEREPLSVVKKSRDMMASWAVVAYFTLQAMTTPDREIIIQSETGPKGEQMVEYAKTMWRQQDSWLKEEFPLAKAIEKQAADTLEFANGSQIKAIPQGKDKIRSYHPWGYMQDESAFQPEGMQCLDNALGSGVQKVVLVSSANIGWFSDFTEDAYV